jgi:hypothetical protein
MILKVSPGISAARASSMAVLSAEISSSSDRGAERGLEDRQSQAAETEGRLLRGQAGDPAHRVRPGPATQFPTKVSLGATRRRVTVQMGDVLPLPELDATAARLQGHGVKVI